MNAKQLQTNSKSVQPAKRNGLWLTIARLTAALAAAVLIVLAGRPATSQPPAVSARQPALAASAMNSHLYVPCSVGGCASSKTAVMNDHLYVPCSVTGCAPSKPVVMNNHLYVPCSVGLCDRSR